MTKKRCDGCWETDNCKKIDGDWYCPDCQKKLKSMGNPTNKLPDF